MLDPANIPVAQTVLEAKWKRRAVLQSQLDDVDSDNRRRTIPDSPDAVNRVVSQFERLGEQICHADPAIGREAFRKLFGSVRLLWHPKDGKRYELARVAIHPNNGIMKTAGNRT